MKISHRLLILTLILILSVASIAAAPAAAKAAFAGLWKGTAADGGKNELRITYTNKTYHVEFIDGVVAQCGGGKASGKGNGQVVGNTLVTSLSLKCKNGQGVVNASYNVSLVLGSATAAFDSAGTSYALRRGVGCSGR